MKNKDKEIKHKLVIKKKNYINSELITFTIDTNYNELLEFEKQLKQFKKEYKTVTKLHSEIYYLCQLRFRYSKIHFTNKISKIVYNKLYVDFIDFYIELTNVKDDISKGIDSVNVIAHRGRDIANILNIKYNNNYNTYFKVYNKIRYKILSLMLDDVKQLKQQIRNKYESI